MSSDDILPTDSPEPSDSYATLAIALAADDLDMTGQDNDNIIPQTDRKDDLEESLETHEVIELQAFIERKEWIDDKIKVRTALLL